MPQAALLRPLRSCGRVLLTFYCGCVSTLNWKNKLKPEQALAPVAGQRTLVTWLRSRNLFAAPDRRTRSGCVSTRSGGSIVCKRVPEQGSGYDPPAQVARSLRNPTHRRPTPHLRLTLFFYRTIELFFPYHTGLPSFMLVYNECRAELYLTAMIRRTGL